MVLNRLVGENHSAFIPGRQISDNILLAREFMRGYNWKTWGDLVDVLLKLTYKKHMILLIGSF